MNIFDQSNSPLINYIIASIGLPTCTVGTKCRSGSSIYFLEESLLQLLLTSGGKSSSGLSHMNPSINLI